LKQPKLLVKNFNYRTRNSAHGKQHQRFRVNLSHALNQRIFTGVSNEKAHSSLKTLSPAFGILTMDK
jgi:hypothetical protein